MPLTIYFLRHGETTASQSGGYCGDLDLELTDSGRQMAAAFGAAYKHIKWTAIFASPMKRTIATAKPLADAIGATPQLRDGLKEISYGEWEGKTPGDVMKDYHDDFLRWQADPGWHRPTGGENGVDVARRSTAVLRELESTYSDGNVLVVSHKATIRIMLCTLLEIDIGRYRDRIEMAVGGVSSVTMTPVGPQLQELGNRAYMGDELRNRHGT